MLLGSTIATASPGSSPRARRPCTTWLHDASSVAGVDLASVGVDDREVVGVLLGDAPEAEFSHSALQCVLGRGLLGPAVVGFADGRAHHVVEQHQLAGHLVARQLACGSAPGGPRAVGSVPGAGLHDRRDPLDEPVVGDAHDHRVEHVGVRLQRRLHLFRVHLLAAGVDAHRAAPEHRDRSVGLDGGEVAGQDPARAVGGDEERRRRLLVVLVVAERDVAPARQPADHAGPGLDRSERRRRAPSCGRPS